MKPVKKILALILAGVMALALLTGCGKAASPDRAVAEGVADWIKYNCSQNKNTNKISVSYQVPELRREIVPLFGTNWMSTDDEVASPDKNAVISGTTTVADALHQCLSNYTDASSIVFYATDVTGEANLVSVETVKLLLWSKPVVVSGKPDNALKNITHVRIATTHKTIGEQTFLLAVVIMEK